MQRPDDMTNAPPLPDLNMVELCKRYLRLDKLLLSGDEIYLIAQSLVESDQQATTLRDQLGEAQKEIERLRLDRDRLVNDCPYCHKHPMGGVMPCVLHGGCATTSVAKDETGKFKFVCPTCGEDAGATRAATARADASEKDARRYRHLRSTRAVMLLTGFFGNGCVNKEIAEVDAAIDEGIAALS